MTQEPRRLRLVLEPGLFAIARLGPDETVPAWADAGGFSAVVRTRDELSVLCRQAAVPGGTRAERGWRLLSLEGPFGFGETGILAAVLAPLARAGVGILALSTFDTDHVLVKEGGLDTALAALEAAGHAVARAEGL